MCCCSLPNRSIFNPEEKAICVYRDPADKPVTPPSPLASLLSLTHTQPDTASVIFSSCLQKDKDCTSTPDFLFSVLSVMLSRSPKRSLVMNWWCVGTMPVCRLDAVSASSCSRFSRRCSSKIFCKQETRLSCVSAPDMTLLYCFHSCHTSLMRINI